MGKHAVPRGEKSTKGAANGSPGTAGYEGRHGVAGLNDRGVATDSRLRIPGWLKGGKRG